MGGGSNGPPSRASLSRPLLLLLVTHDLAVPALASALYFPAFVAVVPTLTLAEGNKGLFERIEEAVGWFVPETIARSKDDPAGFLIGAINAFKKVQNFLSGEEGPSDKGYAHERNGAAENGHSRNDYNSRNEFHSGNGDKNGNGDRRGYYTDTKPPCCRVCSKGKPCGDSCIAQHLKCHKPAGCACSNGKKCCKICSERSKPCGDSCIQKQQQCSKIGGCACSKAMGDTENSKFDRYTQKEEL